MNMQTIMFPIEIMCENLHCIISASSSSITEVTLNLGVFFLYGSWGKRACSTKIYVKMEIFTISGFGSSRRMWLCSLIGVIRQPLASYMSQIWSWDFCRGTSMYYVHSVSYVYAVLPFYDEKCLCSRGRELGRDDSHSH